MGLKIDGIAASSAIDTSSEAIDIENLDISSLKAGQGVLNYEHRNPKQPGASFLDILGAITFARKIMSEEDCENDRQRFYWDQVQLPFCYIQAELFDDEKHPGAVAAAAIIRFYHERGMPILVRFSIDGHTIERDGNVLKHCIARDVALTIKPANHSCVSGVLDEKAKSSGGLDELSRSEDGMHRLPGVEFRMMPPDDAVALVRSELVSLRELSKAMTVSGAGMTAPGDARGGAALVKEDVQGLKTRLTTAFRDWTRKSTLSEHLAKTLPDVHPDFLQKFVELVTESRLRKASELHEFLNKALDGKAKGLEGQIADLGPAFTPMDPDAGNADAKTKGLGTGGKPANNPRAAEDADIENIRSQMRASHPAAADIQGGARAAEAAGLPPVDASKLDDVPHVPGLRIGVHPDHAHDKDIAAVNAMILTNNPAAAQIQGVPAAKPPLRTVAKREGDDEEAVEDKSNAPLTIRGAGVPSNPGKHIPTFDRNSGILHTERGSFPMYIPSRDDPKHKASFHKILEDKRVNEFHSYAVRNWARLNERMKAGTIPPAVIMHATLFSQLSPNTPVPMQELMYGHLVDHMNETGLDARHPAFGNVQNRDAWKARDQAKQAPKQSPEHWDALGGEIRLKGDSDAKFNDKTGAQTKEARQGGDFKSFMLADNKWKNMAQYSTIHNRLTGLINGNRDDARKSVRELMLEKTRGQGIPGLAPKTSRYMMGMLGGGNVMVPDTHFIRYLFGLDKKTDARSIDYLKNVMWRDTVPGADTLEGIDDYYFRHHDAVQHMLNHPEHGKLFKDNPESAIFPAFWKNWVSIVPHERAREMTTRGHNEFTDHRPFWEAVAPFMKSEGGDQHLWELAAKTADQHKEWAHKHGEAQAMMLYYAHLLPHLMAVGDMQKSEAAPAPAAASAPEVLRVRGKDTIPGELRYRDDLHHPLAGKSLKLVADEPEHYEVLSGSGPSASLDKIPKSLQGKAYEVIRPAVMAPDRRPLGMEQLTHASRSPEQIELANRIDFSKPLGHDIRPSQPGRTMPTAHAESAFYGAARDVFGLGNVVPPTVAFHHPDSGELHTARDFAQGRHTARSEHLQPWHDAGVTPRMAVMDYVLGHGDRWVGSYLMGHDAQPKLIDNGDAFHYGGFSLPDYVPHAQRRAAFQPDVHQWLQGLDENKLRSTLARSGVPPQGIEGALQRLGGLKQTLAEGRPLGYHSLVK